MANTYSLIQSFNLSSGSAANISFTSIPQTYTDLYIRLCARTTAGTYGGVNFSFNNDTNMSARYVAGNGANPEFGAMTNYFGDTTGGADAANYFGVQDMYLPDYTVSKNKSYVIDSVEESNVVNPNYLEVISGNWATTSAINAITLTPIPASGSFAQHTTAYLYGVLKS